MTKILFLTALTVCSVATSIATSTAEAKAQKPNNKMEDVLKAQAALGAKPIEKLPPPEARLQPTVGDGLMAVLAKSMKVPDMTGLEKTYNAEIKTPNGPLSARVYKPAGNNLPVTVYFHGGGWVIADIDVYDGSAFSLAKKSGNIVVSVEYRKAPEHKFPAAHDDAYAAYKWVVENASALSGNGKRVSVAGESAGGNLAMNVAIAARDAKFQMPHSVVAVYPVASSDMNSESYKTYADAKPLNKPMMEWFAKHYLVSMDQANDPRINLVGADLKGLPPTMIIAAEIDPLKTDGEMLNQKLKEAGVKVTYRKFDGVTHEFFGLGDYVPQAKEAQALAAGALK